MSLTPDELRVAARAWVANDHDPLTRREIEALLDADDVATLARYWSAPLAFGTAGLRGPLQAGPSGLNRRTVRRATQGVVAWLRAGGPELVARGVVVGCDARHGSSAFYDEVLAVLAHEGVAALALPRALPTPLVPFAVRTTGAAAGVMITASHNPREDNGYKLYVADGAQVNEPDDAVVERGMAEAPELGDLPLVTPDTRRGDEVLAAYRARQIDHFAGTDSELRIVYTPLHGVGGELLRSLARACGFPHLTPVEAQFRPDGDFPTVRFPNPEEPGALDLALATAADVNADLILANDPDADRVAVCLPVDGAWRPLTGDETGWLLAARALRLGVDGVVATSVVSSPLLHRLAADAGVPSVTTLTGFKWIARAGDASDVPLTFGYEEALGYAVDPLVRDKDGVSAALALLREADDAAQHGETLADRLARLRARYGDVRTTQVSVRADGRDGVAQLHERIADLVAAPPTSLGGSAVRAVYDLAHGYLGLPPTAGVLFELADQARVVIRPSGTEPKVKAYCEALGAERVAAIAADVRDLFA